MAIGSMLMARIHTGRWKSGRAGLGIAAILAAPGAASAQSARYVIGEATSYSIEYSSTSHSDLRLLFGMDTKRSTQSSMVHNVESELRGVLEQRVLSQDSVIHVAFRFPDAVVVLKVNGDAAASDAGTIRTHLAKPIFAVMTNAGKILSVSFDSLADERSRLFARNVLSSMEFVIPPGTRTPATWKSEEQDLAGVYEASYTLQGTSLTKRRTSYLSQTPQSRSGPVTATQIIQPGGSATAIFDNAGVLTGIDSYELQRVKVADKQIANGVTKLRLRRVGSRRMSAADLAQLRRLEGGSRSVLAPGESVLTDTAAQRTELGTATLGSLLRRLVEIEKNPAPGDASTELYLKFKAMVYLHPESSDALGRLLLNASPSSPTMLILSQALGSVGHARAQRALSRAITMRSAEWPALVALIPVLGGVREPEEETVKLISDLAFSSKNRDIRSTSLLALGTLAKSLGSSARGNALVRRLVKAVDTAESAQAKRDLLFALGNSGSTLALPAIQRLTRATDQSVRATAYFALRNIEGAAVDRLLARASRSDPDSTARAWAKRAIEIRKR